MNKIAFIGVGIIIYAGLTGFLRFVRRAPDTKIYLAKGLAMGLEFKMGSEILRTVVVREWREIGIVAGIIALRAALTFLIHWEIKPFFEYGQGRGIIFCYCKYFLDRDEGWYIRIF